jgi:hypothetical protein
VPALSTLNRTEMNNCSRNTVVALWLKRIVRARMQLCGAVNSQSPNHPPEMPCKWEIVYLQGTHQSIPARIIFILVIRYRSTARTSVLRVWWDIRVSDETTYLCPRCLDLRPPHVYPQLVALKSGERIKVYSPFQVCGLASRTDRRLSQHDFDASV